MTRLIVLATGESEWDLQGRLASETDVALSERGVAQAERAAASLRRISFDIVLSAPASRARLTAASVLAARIAPRVEVDPRLRELGFGPFEGFAPRHPDALELHAAYRAWREESPFAPAGCEPFTSAARRARSLVAAVSRTPGTVLLVTHEVFACILLTAAVLGLPAHAYGRVRLDPGALAEVRLDPALPPQLVGVNLGAPVAPVAPLAQTPRDEAGHRAAARMGADGDEHGTRWGGRAAAH